MSRRLERAAAEVRAAGRRGDTVLAHINPDEAALLRRLGGAGTRNPATGLPEFSWGSEPGSDFGDDDKAAGDLDGWAGSEGGSSWGPDRGPGSGWNGGENNPETRDFARKEAQRYIDERYGSIGGDLEAGRYGRALERGLGAAARGLAGMFGLSFTPVLDPATGRLDRQVSFDPVAALAMAAGGLGLTGRAVYGAYKSFGMPGAMAVGTLLDPKVAGGLSTLAGRPFSIDLGRQSELDARAAASPGPSFGSPGEGGLALLAPAPAAPKSATKGTPAVAPLSTVRSTLRGTGRARGQAAGATDLLAPELDDPLAPAPGGLLAPRR